MAVIQDLKIKYCGAEQRHQVAVLALAQGAWIQGANGVMRRFVAEDERFLPRAGTAKFFVFDQMQYLDCIWSVPTEISADEIQEYMSHHVAAHGPSGVPTPPQAFASTARLVDSLRASRAWLPSDVLEMGDKVSLVHPMEHGEYLVDGTRYGVVPATVVSVAEEQEAWDDGEGDTLFDSTRSYKAKLPDGTIVSFGDEDFANAIYVHGDPERTHMGVHTKGEVLSALGVRPPKDTLCPGTYAVYLHKLPWGWPGQADHPLHDFVLRGEHGGTCAARFALAVICTGDQEGGYEFRERLDTTWSDPQARLHHEGIVCLVSSEAAGLACLENFKKKIQAPEHGR